MKIIIVLAILLVIGISGCTSGSIANKDAGSLPVQNQDNLQTGLNEGDLAIDFSVTDIDGKTFSRESWNGKPAMLFFTTTWCTPCSVGAGNLARYDDETGGDAFNVAIVFLDPSEEEAKLRQWKESFGRDDWFIAYDNGIAQNYQVQYLDTKYVLDEDGIIRWFNLQLLPYETAKKIMGELI